MRERKIKFGRHLLRGKESLSAVVNDKRLPALANAQTKMLSTRLFVSQLVGTYVCQTTEKEIRKWSERETSFGAQKTISQHVRDYSKNDSQGFKRVSLVYELSMQYIGVSLHHNPVSFCCDDVAFEAAFSSYSLSSSCVEDEEERLFTILAGTTPTPTTTTTRKMSAVLMCMCNATTYQATNCMC